MKRVTKVLVAGVGAAGMLAFLFFVPIVPATVTTYDLYSQHGLCIGTEIDPAPTLVIYGSASYILSLYGVVYVPTGGHLWWLPSSGQSSKLTCI